jgi:hypothetical protein
MSKNTQHEHVGADHQLSARELTASVLGRNDPPSQIPSKHKEVDEPVVQTATNPIAVYDSLKTPGSCLSSSDTAAARKAETQLRKFRLEGCQ